MPNVFETADFLQAARDRVKEFVSARGDSIGTICGERIFLRMAPDNVAMPYVVVTLDGSESDPGFSNLKREFQLGILGVSSDPQESELLADLGEAALLTWRNSSAAEGLMYGVRAARDTTEPNDPALRDRCETRVVVTLAAWTQPLTSANTTT
jgi:hypothetical protein